MILARLRCRRRGHQPIHVSLPRVTQGVLPPLLDDPIIWRNAWICERCHREVNPPS